MGDVVVGGATVEVKATLEPLVSALSQGETRTKSFEKTATASLDRVAQAHNRTAAAISKGSKTAGTAEDQLAEAIAGTGRMSAAAVKELGGLDQVQKRVEQSARGAAKAGKDQMEVWRQQARAAKELADQQERNAKFSKFMGVGGGSGKSASDSASVFAGEKEPLTRGERAGRLNLGRQAADVFTTGAMGMNPAMIAIQQGPQILDAMALSGIRASAAMIGLGVAVGAVAVAAIGTVVAVDKYNTALAESEALTAGVGRSAGVTALQLDAMARSGAAASGSTVGQARELEKQLLKTGAVGGDVFQGLILAQKKYANATGQDLKGAQAELANMFADPAAGADMLQSKFHSLTTAERDNIQALARHGDMLGAQKALLDALNRAVADTSGNLGGMKGTVDIVSSGFSRFGTFLVDVVTKLQLVSTYGPQALAQLQKIEAQQRDNAAARQLDAQAKGASTAGVDLARQLDPDFAPRQNLETARDKLGRGIGGAVATGQVDDLREQAQAYNNVVRAQQTYLSQSEKAHRLSQLDAQANEVRSQKETAATRATLGRIAADRVRIELSGQVMSAGEVEQRAADAAATASSKAARASTGHADTLRREAEAMTVNTAQALAMADAYLVSDAAGQKAESKRKAMTDATRKGADLEAQVRRQTALDVAEQAAAGAKLVSTTSGQVAAQQALNAAVADGTVPEGQASKMLSQQLALRPLVAAALNAEGEAREKLVTIIARLRLEYAALNKTELEGQLDVAHGQARDNLAAMEREAQLVGATNAVRDRELAILAKRQELLRSGGTDALNSPKGQQAVRDAADAADAANKVDAARFTQAQTDAIGSQIDALHAQAAALGMTYQQSATYLKEQQLLEEATRRGITLTDEQNAKLHQLAAGYGQATEAARKLTEQQKAAAEAAGFWADQVQGAISDTIWEGKSAKAALGDVVKAYGKARLESFLTGTGPLAGVQGTNQSTGPGQPNGGMLSQLFGKAFGVGQGGAPTGSSTSPFYVVQASPTGVAGADPIGDLINKAGGAWGADNDNGLTDQTKPGGMDAGKGFLDQFGAIFQRNTEGGFLGKLKGVFGSLGGLLNGMGGGGGGGLGGLLGSVGSLFGGGGGGGGWFGGATAGADAVSDMWQSGASVLAGLYHDGTSGPPRSRTVPAHLFLTAPRLHNGLAPDEFTAILQTGERVQSRDEVARDKRAKGSTGPVNVYVTAKDADSFNRSARQVTRGLNRRFKAA